MSDDKKPKSVGTLHGMPVFSIDGAFAADREDREWLNHPTFRQRPQKVYWFTTENQDTNSVPFIAHPRKFKDTLN